MIVAVALFSLAVIALTGTWIAILLRARNKHLLIDRMHGQVSDAEGNIGFSLLCSGVQRLGQIENLLSSEYDRCEVIAVLDAWQQRLLFEKLAARYRMIRVDYLPSDELPVHGVRSMWRSRQRCFRRLVLLDRPEDSAADDWNAAASVASYDWLIPVRDGQYMLPGALERLAAEAGQERTQLVRSWMGHPFALFDRERVAAAGGFGNRPVRQVPRRHRRLLWEPLFYRPQAKSGHRKWRPWAALALGGAIAATAATGHWVLTVLLLDAATAWSAAACADQLLAAMAGRTAGCKIGVKNFTDS